MRTGPYTPLMLLLAFLASGRPDTAPATEIDRVMAVVNGTPITGHRLRIYRDYLTVLKGDGLGRPTPIPLSEISRTEVLTRVVMVDEILFTASERIESLQVSGEDVQTAIANFRSRFPSPEAFDSFTRIHEFTPASLRDFFFQRISVERYIDLKVGAGQFSMEELQAYFDARATEFPGQTFTEAREAVRRRLYSLRASERFDRWVADLLQQASIQIPAAAPARGTLLPGKSAPAPEKDP